MFPIGRYIQDPYPAGNFTGRKNRPDRDRPHESRRIGLYDPKDTEDWTETQDIWLTISVRWREKQEWSQEEHCEAAFHQECIREGKAERPKTSGTEDTEAGGLHITEKYGTIYIEGKNFTVEFDRVHGISQRLY